MAEVLVTGGAGFIGSHLVDALLADGRTVVVLDDFSTGHAENLPDHPGLRVVRGDVRDAALLAELAEAHAFEEVHHLAAIASVARSIEDPVATLSVNTEGSVRLATWAARSLPGLKRFVFASSAATYGSEVRVPTRESDPGRPDAPYGLEKATVERYLELLARTEGLPAVCARFFNVYGPRQDPSSPYSGVLSIVTRALHDGRPFTVHGDGGQTRDFVYVADVVAALTTLARQPDAVGGTFNVGTGREASLLEVVDLLESVAGRELERTHGPPRAGDIRRSVADVTALRGLGWRPERSLRDGLTALWAATC